MRTSARIAFILLFSSLAFCAFADMDFNDFVKEYTLAQRLTGEMDARTPVYHAESRQSIVDGDLDWEALGDNKVFGLSGDSQIEIFPSTANFSYNTAKDMGMNDGAIWQGKGLNGVIISGAEYKNSFMSVRLQPEVWFAQNQDYDIIETSNSDGWGDYYTEWDNLQRMGDDAVYDFDFGQSEVRFYYEDSATIGFSNEEIIIGYGRQNNLILSNNAGGFPHIDLGTVEPLHWNKVGDFDLNMFWGALHESDYYDDDEDNDWAWFSGLSISYSPDFVPGLTIGFSNIYYKDMNEVGGIDMIGAIPGVLQNSVGNDDDADGITSIDFCWLFPGIGFTVYGEWANNDYSWPYYASPQHTAAFMLGAAQVVKNWGDGRKIMVSFEHSNLNQSDYPFCTFSRYMVSSWVCRLDAGVYQLWSVTGERPSAPGSNSQWLDVSYYYDEGKYTFYITRICYDEDYYYNYVINQDDYEIKDQGDYQDYIFGLSHLRSLSEHLSLYGELDYIYTRNYNWDYKDNLHHFTIELGAQYAY